MPIRAQATVAGTITQTKYER